MKRIEVRLFVLYTSDKGIEEWDKAIEDKIKALRLKPGAELREQVKEQEKVERVPTYYHVTHDQLEKLFEEMRIKYLEDA